MSEVPDAAKPLGDHDDEQIWQEANHALGLATDTLLDATTATALLRRLLVCWANNGRGSAEWRTYEALTRLHDMVPQLATFLQPDVVEQLQVALQDDVYCRRLAQIAADLLLSEPMAPEICLAPQAQSAAGPAGRSTHIETACDAIIFADPQLITHELYPLFVDACVTNGTSHRLVAVHADWLVGDAAIRIITYDVELDRFVETPLLTPLSLDRVLLLSLGAEEQQLHHDLDRIFSGRCRNPWMVSERLDDKVIATALWSELGLATPRQVTCSNDIEEAAPGLLNGGQEWVLKPRSSTLGQGVSLLSATTPSAQVSRHLQQCRLFGDAILESRRDGICWRDEKEVDHTLAIRLHVASTSEGAHVESGYATVGVDEHTPASKLHGGQTLPLTRVLGSLACRGAGRLDIDAKAVTADLVKTSIAAASMFPGIDLLGVDLVLDVVCQSVEAVVIEANPRPAGLIHSRRLDDGLPGVSNKLWVSPLAVQRETS